ncbi:sigma-E factor negative regulatory protein RseA [Oxalobacteraceae bacterium GrIS 1.11]
MDTQNNMHENISALVDGELAAGDVELVFAALDMSRGRAAWNVYRRIGDILRSDDCGADLSDAFGARLAARLAAEAPLRVAPRGATEPAVDIGAGPATERAASLPLP